ncbi:hypothetical protein ABIB90_007147 [Bradyrhizobium sp. JR4.1]|uniref:nSTAND1 domain-containing NTPase n=1 Tax=Bradyrhizobium sp. JR4.1 TaxID=3156372 RepID=UPI00339B9CBF
MNEQQAITVNRPLLSPREQYLASWVAAQSAHVSVESELNVYPYPGLRSFKPSEADLFYGRDSQINELRELLRKNNIIVVLGGSGSGKSSLVRAGLIPRLNSTAPIPDRAGAWYVVEFRPKLDPATELFDAIFTQIIAPVLAPPQIVDGATVPTLADSVSDPKRRIEALNAALDLNCDPASDIQELKAQYRARLREMLLEGTVVDVGALFDFVDGQLPKLDGVLAAGLTSDAPNLMILIDQFEEVFKPKVDAAGRDMVTSLINSVHAYKPFNLFIVVTMRSEELHRCAEFPGLAEVVNRSLYLVDLIGGKDVEHAIVGPARRLLKSWDLDPGDPDTGPFTRQSLSKLHMVYDRGREVLPHPADQLPLMQHMLPLVWAAAVERWRTSKDGSPLEIDVSDLQSLPGWTSAQGALIGTLNARADDVLRQAVKEGAKRSKLAPAEVERLVRAGFCCLAQLDDRGNVVRDFATLDQMLEASGVFERQPEEERGRCRSALKTALRVFRRATLVNIANQYDVNHEALIRGWARYTGWLKDAQRRASRLVSIDQLIRESVSPIRSGRRLTRLIDRVTDWIFVQKLARADQIAGDETCGDLQDLVGNQPTFSEQWSLRIIERADASASRTGLGASSLERLNAIRQTIKDASSFRAGARYRPRWLLAAVLVLLSAGGLFLLYQIERATQQEQLAEQFRFFRLQKETAAPAPDSARYPGQDRELYAALSMEASVREPPSSKEARSWFKTSVRQLESATREIVSDVVVWLLPKNPDELLGDPDFAHADLGESQCAVVNSGSPSRDLISSKRNLGLRLSVTQLGRDSQAVAMTPVWRAADGTVAEIMSSNFGGSLLPQGSLVCLSHDANWFLMWTPLAKDQRRSPPLLQRILWIRTAPISGQYDANWHAEAHPHRRPTSFQSYRNLDELSDYYEDLRTSIQEGRQPIKSFHVDDRAGFLIPITSTQLALLWTSAGTLDADPVDSGIPRLRECKFIPVIKRDAIGRMSKYLNCNTGKAFFENEWYDVEAEYYDSEGDNPDPSIRCENPNLLCRGQLILAFADGSASTRLSIPHLSAKIVSAEVRDGYFWVQDANHQVWRYVIGPDRLKSLLPYRWKDVPPETLRNVPYSESCSQASRCATMIIPNWPSEKGTAQ